MKPVIIYGIKNCDTMKKTFQWLERHKIAYTFHDYKKTGADTEMLKKALEQYGWQKVLNLKGTTWRALGEPVKKTMNDRQALDTAIKNPSIIRRPMMLCGHDIYMGFDEAQARHILGKK